MAEENFVQVLKSQLKKAIKLDKCKKCGCMKEALENIQTSMQDTNLLDLIKEIKICLKQMKSIEYT